MTPQEKTALKRYNKGETPYISTFIDEDTIISGYGKLDYDFEFPLPVDKVIEIHGTNSWEQYFKNKGLFHWKTINKDNKEQSFLGIRMNIEDIEKLKLIEGNENFEFIKM